MSCLLLLTPPTNTVIRNLSPLVSSPGSYPLPPTPISFFFSLPLAWTALRPVRLVAIPHCGLRRRQFPVLVWGLLSSREARPSPPLPLLPPAVEDNFKIRREQRAQLWDLFYSVVPRTLRTW